MHTFRNNIKTALLMGAMFGLVILVGSFWGKSASSWPRTTSTRCRGVIAHEIGHITGGHVVRFSEGAKAATSITLLSMLLGAAAMAAGAGEAGMAIFAGGQQAALGKFLAYSRTQESAADQAGATFLHKAGLSRDFTAHINTPLGISVGRFLHDNIAILMKTCPRERGKKII